MSCVIRLLGAARREKHEHEYQSIDELRRAASGPVLLRNYWFNISVRPQDDGCALVPRGGGRRPGRPVGRLLPHAPFRAHLRGPCPAGQVLGT